MRNIVERKNFTDDDYGESMTVSLYGFPGAVLLSQVKEQAPKSKVFNNS